MGDWTSCESLRVFYQHVEKLYHRKSSALARLQSNPTAENQRRYQAISDLFLEASNKFSLAREDVETFDRATNNVHTGD